MREPFSRMDPSDDAVFYSLARKVVHLEPGAIEALRGVYAQRFPPGATVLDLMSSWRSHLPDGLGRVVGLGMNAEEMEANPQLDEWVVHDLNRPSGSPPRAPAPASAVGKAAAAAPPRLPFPDGSFDAVACAVSVQYLVHPFEVFADVRRVLAPGGPVVVSFSNRCFPTKAVALWLAGDDDDHRLVVRAYLERSGFADVVDERVETSDDPLFVVSGRAADRGPGGGT
jgi:SAM-dependent methyltransferase